MKSFMNRVKNKLKREDGASNIEIIVWVVVVLVIAVALFLFRDQISDFLGTATDSVGNMDSRISQVDANI